MKSSSHTHPFTFIDLFAGCGGLSLGLMQAGWNGLFAIEHEKNAFQTLRNNLLVEDARYRFIWPDWLPKTEISVEEVIQNYQHNLTTLVGKVDMIVGGPPCQGFSSAGRRDPKDPRNTLVQSYLEFVEIIQPKLVLIENVKGMTQDFDDTSHSSGKVNYSEQIIDLLSKDYHVATQILDTSMFGVPQKRFRFFIIAIKSELFSSLNKEPFEAIENERMSFLCSKGIYSVPVSSKSAISDLEVSRNGKQKSCDSPGFEEISYVGPLTSYQRLMHCGTKISLADTRLARHKPEIISRFEKIIDICHTDGRLNVSLSSELKTKFGLRKAAIRVLDPERPSPTITSMPDDLIHYKEPRTLTVRENARLQSFPDWFKFQGKYTTGGNLRKKEVPRFTQVANAVPPLVAEAVGRTLMQLLINPPLNQQNLTLQQALQKGLDNVKDLA